ncbi:MAG: hypothetical protein ACLQVM_12745 [Terriglobia bacterium]
MIRSTTGRKFLGGRRKTQNVEEKWYYVARCVGDTPPFRPSDEEKIRGRPEAQRKKDLLDAALNDEERKTVRNKILETSPPSLRRSAMGIPKRDPRKRRT